MPPARHRFGQIEVRLPGLTPTASLNTQLRLNALAGDRGEKFGSVFVIGAALLSSLALGIASGFWLREGRFELVVLAAVLLFGAALAGKLFGMSRARRHLCRELDALAQSPTATTPNRGPSTSEFA